MGEGAGRCPKSCGVSYWGKACEADMELFSLHIPDALGIAAIALYWMAVAVGFVLCAQKGWLWGKWRWYLLSMFGSLSVCGLWASKTEAVFCVPLFACVLFFVFKKWKKLNVSPVEYFLMVLFAYPVALVYFLLWVFIYLEVLRMPK